MSPFGQKSTLTARRPSGPLPGVRNKRSRGGLLAAVAALLLLCFTTVARPAHGDQGSYVEIRLEGIVNPLKVRHLARAMDRAEAERAKFILLTLDTPGGLVSSLQELTMAITNSKVPVVGFVEPSSAVPLAAMLEHPDLVRGKRVGVILSGGNVDVATLAPHFG